MKKTLIALIALTAFPYAVSAFVSVPFGGRLISAVPCTCSPYTRITLSTSRGPITLDYPYFSQAYLNYNIPATSYILGNYRVGAMCLDYIGTACSPRVSPPAVGVITPTVGSSLR